MGSSLQVVNAFEQRRVLAGSMNKLYASITKENEEARIGAGQKPKDSRKRKALAMAAEGAWHDPALNG